MKKKTQIGLPLFLLLVIGHYYLSVQQRKTDKKNEEQKASTTASEKREPLGASMRSPASIAPSSLAQDKPQNNDKSSSAPKWKKRLINDLTRNLSSLHTEIDIQDLGERSLNSNGEKRRVRHVQISLTAAGEQRSSFEAYVNAQTGKIYQTWNRTRYEYPQAMAIKAMPLRPSP